MNTIEYKKINYIFSINNYIEENVRNLKLNEYSILFIDKLSKEYNTNIKDKLNDFRVLLDDKKELLLAFNRTIPDELLILRNHIKNCIYARSRDEFKFKFEKYLDEDFKRLKYIQK